MKRLLVVVSLLVVISLGAFAPKQFLYAGDPKEISSWLDEYVADGASESVRASRLSSLRDCDRELLTKIMAQKIKKAANPARLMDVAIALNVPGLFDTCEQKKLFDGETRGKAIDLAFRTLDDKSAKYLMKLWKSADITSSDFKALQEGFISFEVPMIQDLAFFAKLLKDEQRKHHAADVMIFNLGLSSSDCESIAKDWSDHAMEYIKLGNAFTLKGKDLLKSDETITAGKCKKFGANYVLNPGSSLFFDGLCDGMNDSFVFTFRIRINDSKDVKLSAGPYQFTVKEDDIIYHHRTGDFPLENFVQHNDWMVIRFQVVPEGILDGHKALGINATVDQKNILLDRAGTITPPTFSITAGDKPIYIGGAELQK